MQIKLHAQYPVLPFWHATWCMPLFFFSKKKSSSIALFMLVSSREKCVVSPLKKLNICSFSTGYFLGNWWPVVYREGWLSRCRPGKLPWKENVLGNDPVFNQEHANLQRLMRHLHTKAQVQKTLSLAPNRNAQC